MTVTLPCCEIVAVPAITFPPRGVARAGRASNTGDAAATASASNFEILEFTDLVLRIFKPRSSIKDGEDEVKTAGPGRDKLLIRQVVYCSLGLGQRDSVINLNIDVVPNLKFQTGTDADQAIVHFAVHVLRAEPVVAAVGMDVSSIDEQLGDQIPVARRVDGRRLI